MNVSIIRHVDGVDYVSLTDFAKEYRKLYSKKLNIAQLTRGFPKRYILSTKGRHGSTFISTSIIELFFNSKRSVPSELVNRLYEHIKIKSIRKANNMELFFIDIVISFMRSMIHDIHIEKHRTIGYKNYDLCINDKILIEFDEYSHVCQVENDSIKDSIANINGYKLIRVKSNSDYGVELANIYKKVKEVYF